MINTAEDLINKTAGQEEWKPRFCWSHNLETGENMATIYYNILDYRLTKKEIARLLGIKPRRIRTWKDEHGEEYWQNKVTEMIQNIPKEERDALVQEIYSDRKRIIEERKEKYKIPTLTVDGITKTSREWAEIIGGGFQRVHHMIYYHGEQYAIERIRKIINGEKVNRSNYKTWNVTIKGVTKCLSEWCRIIGVKLDSHQMRVRRETLNEEEMATYIQGIIEQQHIDKINSLSDPDPMEYIAAL